MVGDVSRQAEAELELVDHVALLVGVAVEASEALVVSRGSREGVDEDAASIVRSLSCDAGVIVVPSVLESKSMMTFYYVHHLKYKICSIQGARKRYAKHS